MPFKRYVEIGRIALVNYGKDYGKLVVIVDVIDQNRALVDAPDMVRGQMNFKRLTLTDIKIDIKRVPDKKTLIAAMEAADVKNKWENCSWGRKFIVQKKRASLNDFDRFKIMLAKIKKAGVVKQELAKLKKETTAYFFRLVNFFLYDTASKLQIARFVSGYRRHKEYEGEEQQEIQIGMPTDVKHLAHIGADGPATESPSWMRDFGAGQGHSASMDMTPDTNKGTKNHRITRSEELTRDLPDVPKTSRHRRRSMDNSMDHDSQSSTKTKHRRHHRLRRSHDKDKGDLPDIPKKSRRKKPKDDDGSTKSTISKDSESSAGDF